MAARGNEQADRADRLAAVLTHDEMVRQHLRFFQNGGAGCVFAAIAAKDPKEVGWRVCVCADPSSIHISSIFSLYMGDPRVSTISILFPSVETTADLVELSKAIARARGVATDRFDEDGRTCLGFRLSVSGKKSWVAGFGPFAHFPRTRQAPCTAIVLRVKDSPKYEVEIDKTPEGIVHVANMEIKRLNRQQFESVNEQSYRNTMHRLGGTPDIFSAAKTTFSFPNMIEEL